MILLKYITTLVIFGVTSSPWLLRVISFHLSNVPLKICSLSESGQWFHVSCQLNPTNLPSRGCTLHQMLNLFWWEGPQWIKYPRNSWPILEINPDEEVVNLERMKSATLGTNVNVNKPKWYERFSKYFKVIAWIRRS